MVEGEVSWSQYLRFAFICVYLVYTSFKIFSFIEIIMDLISIANIRYKYWYYVKREGKRLKFFEMVLKFYAL